MSTVTKPQPEALELLDQAAWDPSMDELMLRAPVGFNDTDLRAKIALLRSDRATWRAKP